MNDAERPLIDRARDGDWEAIEDLVAGAIAPTFDAALNVFGDPSEAATRTEEALLAILLAVRSGELRSGDPLVHAARALAAAAKGVSSGPFESGLSADDLVAIGKRPDVAGRANVTSVPAADRVATVLAFALGLPAADLALAVNRPAAEVQNAIDRTLAAIPHERPEEALRDILDARASRVRVPLDVEERVLDRFEQSA